MRFGAMGGQPGGTLHSVTTLPVLLGLAATGGLGGLFDTTGFPPRWRCGQWTAAHGWVHIVSDLLIFGAYMTIPVAIVVYIRRRHDAPFPRLLWMFGAFIAACGTAHLIEAMIFWWPIYRVSGLVKVITALVSWATVFVMLPLLPGAFSLPRLKKTNEEMERALYTVSHDLKSPLVTVEGHLDLLERRGDAQSRESLHEIRDAAGQMRRMIEDLLSLGRLSHGEEKPTAVSLDGLFRQLLAVHSRTITQKRVSIRVTPGLPVVVAERMRLLEVFDNLLVNALKYACGGPGPTIRVHARIEERELRVCVQDNGPGIAPEHQERVFGLFERLDRRIEGTGVGLSIVRRIAESYGGRAWVESQPGSGASFWIALPMSMVLPGRHAA